MFLPVSDNNRRSWIRYHFVTLALIAACTAVFIAQTLGTEEDFARLMYGLGLIPAVVTLHFGQPQPPEGQPGVGVDQMCDAGLGAVNVAALEFQGYGVFLQGVQAR